MFPSKGSPGGLGRSAIERIAVIAARNHPRVAGTRPSRLTDGGIDRAHLTELCSRALYGAIGAAIEVDKKS
jgi:hypothetical protein